MPASALVTGSMKYWWRYLDNIAIKYHKALKFNKHFMVFLRLQSKRLPKHCKQYFCNNRPVLKRLYKTIHVLSSLGFSLETHSTSAYHTMALVRQELLFFLSREIYLFPFVSTRVVFILFLRFSGNNVHMM
jgi:hypothetical protein